MFFEFSQKLFALDLIKVFFVPIFLHYLLIDSLEALELPFMVRKLGFFINGASSFLIANAYRFGVCIYTYSDAEGKQLLAELVVQEKISAISINGEGNLVIAFQNGTFSRAVSL